MQNTTSSPTETELEIARLLIESVLALLAEKKETTGDEPMADSAHRDHGTSDETVGLHSDATGPSDSGR